MSKYSDETKAAVMAALLTGQSVSAVAKEYKIPHGTVRSWKSRQLNGESVATVATVKKVEIGDLLIEYLRENLATLRAQVIAFRNEDWLSRQDASDVAVLHGVLTDKAVRLIEAMSHVSDDTDTDS
jgi:transposase-like protein